MTEFFFFLVNYPFKQFIISVLLNLSLVQCSWHTYKLDDIMTFEPHSSIYPKVNADVYLQVIYSLIQGVVRLEHIKQHQLMKSLCRVLKHYSPLMRLQYA